MKRYFNATSLKANIAANFIGNGWMAILSLIFVPFYIKYIGAEGYGLIGLFASLQVLLSLLDSGLSTTLNKELASLSAKDNHASEMRNLVRTLELIYWGLASLIGIIAVLLSPLLARYWVHPQNLSVETISHCFVLLSVSLIFQFPIGFYTGGLLGLQRHVHLNVLRVVFGTLKSAGALLVLIFYSPTVITFFTWTLIVSIANAVAIVLVLWYYLPSDSVLPQFDKFILRKIWRFAAGMSGIALTSVLLTQIDKIILSKVLPLDQFGYYTLASTLGMFIYQIVYPLVQSYFPKFSFLIGKGEFVSLKKFYHQGCQVMSTFIVPAALMLIFFSKSLLLIWTNDARTATKTWEIVSFIAAGTAINGLLSLPFVLTLSHGWTGLSFYTNLVMIVIMVPGYIFMSFHFGAVGAAACWTIINSIYLFVLPIMIHSKVLIGEAPYWYWNDVFKPLIASSLFVFICKILLMPYQFGRWTSLAILVTVGIITVFISISVTKEFRQKIYSYVGRLFLKTPFLIK